MSYSAAETTYAPANALAPHLYDDPALIDGSVTVVEGVATAELLLKGVRCTACCRRIENALATVPGIKRIDLNFTARRLTVHFQEADARLGATVHALRRLGFDAVPWCPAESRTALDAELRANLKRLGVAGAFGMQVMTIAVAMYLGDASGMDDGMRLFLVRLSVVLTLPVLLYSARPFLLGALDAIRHKRVEMDVTVTLAILLAFAGSLWASLTGSGSVYLESICMFVFLLTGARLVELHIRRRANMSIDHLATSEPISATRVAEPGATTGKTVPAIRLSVGDVVLVGAGATVPSDGVVERGTSRFNEAMLTGESRPATRGVDSFLLAGAVNCENPVWMRVTRPASMSMLSRIGKLADSLQREGDTSTIIERVVAGTFITAVLIVAVSTALVWLWIDGSRALAITVAVLAVACPCALSLAVPVALSAANARLIAARTLPASKFAVRDLASITNVVFDKTGTLTLNDLTVSRVRYCGCERLDADDENRCLAAVAALESTLQHPLANAIVQYSRARGLGLPPASAVKYTPAAGVSGIVDGTQWLVGSVEYLRQNGVELGAAEHALGPQRVWICNNDCVVGAIEFEEPLRPDAVASVAELGRLGLRVHILSGDDAVRVTAVARTVGAGHTLAQATPERKRDYIQAIQRGGGRVLMIGDGVNDSPALSLADVSAVVTGATSLATSHADLVLLSERLDRLVDAIQVARKTRAVIRQNISWALAYNCLSIPLAAAGFVPPWVAAAGMSMSSIVVVANALRLMRKRPMA